MWINSVTVPQTDQTCPLYHYTRLRLDFIYISWRVHTLIQGPSPKSSNSQAYLCNERAVLLHLMVVVMATSQELPYLPSEGFGDAAADERGERFGPYSQVHVPERGGRT